MKKELDEAIRAIIETVDRNKYNSAIGFFQNYAPAEADSLGVRFANIKLHYKDDDGEDISATVPLLQMGNENSIIDFRLSEGSELLVFFTDRTLEQWKDKTALSPQLLTKNKVKDSINHGIAIPICSHHNSALITTTALPTDVGLRVGVKSGKKVQVGNDNADALDLINQTLEVIIQADSGGDTFPGLSVKGNTLTQIQTLLKTIAKTV